MVDSKLNALVNYFVNKSAKNLNEKDQLLLLKSLKLPYNESILKLYEKLNFLNTIEKDIYLKKANKEQIDLILSKSIPIDFKRLHILIYLLIKNYPEYIKDICSFVQTLSFEQKKDILNNILFGEKEIKILAIYLKNDTEFIRGLIEKQKITYEIFKILSQSQEPEALYFLSNLTSFFRENVELIDLLLNNPYTPDESMSQLKFLKYEMEQLKNINKSRTENEVIEDKSLEVKKVPEHFEKEIDKKFEENIYSKILKMSIPEKIKLALTGNKSARNILIKDSNKQIALNVLKNPRITEEEIDFITKNKMTSDFVLREIAKNNNWIKNYQIVKNLAFNPKTPVDIALQLLNRLYINDLEYLSKSREVSNVVKSQAYRLIKLKSKK